MIAKVPNAAFAYTAQDASNPPDVGNELASMIEALFLREFGNAQSSKWAARVWLIETSLDSKRFGVSLKFLKARQEWRLIASTLDWPAKFSLLLSRWGIECNVELKIICNEIHGLLSHNPQVSGLRWFYPRGHQAVVAPSDLWAQPLTTHSSGRSPTARAAKFGR